MKKTKKASEGKDHSVPIIETKVLSSAQRAQVAVEAVWSDNPEALLPEKASLLSQILSDSDPVERREAVFMLLDRSRQKSEARLEALQSRDKVPESRNSHIRMSSDEGSDQEKSEEKVA